MQAVETYCTATVRPHERLQFWNLISNRIFSGTQVRSADPVFDADQQAVLALVVEMTREVKVQDATFARVRRVLGSDGLVFELVGVIAAYNMVSRILVALELEP